MSKDLYDIVADKVLDFCHKTWYYDCLVKFDISYDEKEWESVTCVVECDVNKNIVFQWDFCEGQKYIRNFRICHTDEAEIPLKMTDLEKEFSAKGFANEMRRIKREYESDPEAVHDKMDECMCRLLRELGYSEGMQIFEDTEKWYG